MNDLYNLNGDEDDDIGKILTVNIRIWVQKITQTKRKEELPAYKLFLGGFLKTLKKRITRIDLVVEWEGSNYVRVQS